MVKYHHTHYGFLAIFAGLMLASIVEPEAIAQTTTNPNAFITTWEVNAEQTITIPTDDDNYTYNYIIDWGDGTEITGGHTGNVSHTYSNADTYAVAITGTFPALRLRGNPNIRTIEQWGDIVWQSIHDIFTSDLSINANAGSPDLSSVTSLASLFHNRQTFNSPIGHWDVSNITDMSQMFQNASAFNQDLSAWDVSEVTNMDKMFNNAGMFDQNLGSWDVGNVTNMNNMFNNVTLSRQNYDALLAGWTQIEYGETPLRQDIQFNAGKNSQYCNQEARASLILLGWTIKDGGPAANCPPPAPRANQLSVASLLVPPGLNIGTQVRLLFVDGNTNFTNNDISHYNNEVITAAAESNSASIRRFSDQFRALISADTVDARENTYTSEDPGVPIYWVGGDKVADNYADFYDGSWDSRNARDNSGRLVNTAGLTILTGSLATGVGEPGTRINDRGNGVRVGQLDRADAEIDSGTSNNNILRPLYGLSPVLTLVSVGPQPPVVQNPIPNQVSTAREEFSYTFAENVFYDINMDELTYSVTTPTWLSIDPSNPRTIHGIVPSAAVRQSPIYVTVVASDGNPITADTSSAFLLTVNPNDPAPPANVRAVAGNGSITVTWDLLVEDGGIPVTYFRVRTLRRLGGVQSECAVRDDPGATGCTITRLINGLEYGDISVEAHSNPFMPGLSRISLTTIEDVFIPRSSTTPIPEDAFITTWRFDYSINERITIPTHSSSNYSYSVDWGDGSIDNTIYTGDAIHDYPPASRLPNYVITISGTFPRIYFNNSGDKEKIRTIQQWGNTVWTSMENSFYGCNNLAIETNAGQPNLSSVTSTKGMFRDATRINQSMNDWDVSSVSNMEDMFSGATAFNQDLSMWDVSNVTDTSSMFNGATAFNQDLSTWDVSAVTDTSGMFNGATAFNQNLSTWNVSSVTDMSGMFNGAAKFNQDLSAWNVSSVTDMSDMFNDAAEFNQDLGAWDVGKVTYMSDMFNDVELSTANYDSLLAGWGRIEDGETALRSNVNFNAGGSQYCDQEAKDILANAPNEWSIADGGRRTTGCPPDPSAFVTTWMTTITNQTITIPTSNNFTYNYKVDWGDGAKTSGHTSNAMYAYDNVGTYTVAITGTFPAIYFNGGGSGPSIRTIEQWGDIVWQSMQNSFTGVSNLSISANAGSPNLSSVISLASMFRAVQNFNSPIGHWDVSNISNMDQMFQNAFAFNQPLGDWDVSKVTNMRQMFQSASAFNQPLGDWDVSEVTNMDKMFNNAGMFDQNLGSWDVGNVTDMTDMFNNVTLSRQNYDALLAGWTQIEYGETPLQQSVQFNAGNSQYCNSEARALLITLGWTITDGGPAANCPPPAPRADQLSAASLLVPPGLNIGTQVRLLFVDGNTDFTNDDISHYNNEVITAAAESNSAAMRRFSDQFRALISSDTVNARDNTATTYATGDPDVPIYWVGGDKVADNYADFYDGSWDSRNARDNSGNLVNTAGLIILTGSNAAGVGLPNNRVGNSGNGLRVGRLDRTNTEIDSGASSKNFSPLYGLSPVLTLVSVGPQPPVVQNPIPIQSSIAREEFSYTFAENVFYDINMDELTYHVTAPPWLSIDPSNPRTIYGTPPSASVGQSPIYVTIVASDGNPITADTSSAFLLMVGPNDPAPPANARAIAGDRSITVSWDLLVEDGGIPINQYVVNMFRRSDIFPHTCTKINNPGATSCTFMGLINGVEYSDISVQAFTNFATDRERRSFTVIDDILIPRSLTAPAPPEDAFITAWRFNYNINERITIPTHSSSIYAYTVDWGDGSMDNTIYTGDATHDYPSNPGRLSNYVITISGTFPRIYFNNSGDKEKIRTIQQWGNTEWTSMEDSFYGCNNLAIGVNAGQPDLSSVTSTKGMFRDATRINQPMNDWDVSSVSNMEGMFNGATRFSQSLSRWDVSSVTDTSGMFNGATRFNQNLSAWDVSNVTDTSGMFNGAVKFNQNLSAWDVSNVTDTSSMFNGATAFNQNLSTWDVSNVTDTSSMFNGATAFNQDLSAWNVSSVTDMSDMFNGAVEFNQDLGAWDVGKVTDMSDMFNGVELSTANYDSLLAGWGRIEDGEMALQKGVNFNAGGSQYCDQEAKDILTNAPNEWSIADGRQLAVGCPPDPSAFVTTWFTLVRNQSITIPTINTFTYDYTVDWGDGTKTTGHNGDASHTYVTPKTYTITITGTFPTIYFNGLHPAPLILTIEQWGDIVWQSMEGSFRGAIRLSISADAGSPDLSSVTIMRSTFWGSGSNLPIGHWDVSNVTDMSQIFLNNLGFNQPLGDWNVSNVTDMSRMFDGVDEFNQPLGDWDVSKVTNMSRMFSGVTEFNQDLGAWDVGMVTDMTDMLLGVTLSTANYDSLLAGWSHIENDEMSLRSTVTFSAGSSKYCNQEAKDILENDPYNWEITDGGLDTSGVCTLQFVGNTNIANQVYTVGNAITLLLPFTRGGATPLTYSLEPLPSGLTLLPQTVDTAPLLIGTPSVAMPATTVSYTVTAADNETSTLTFIITVVNSLPPETLTLGTVSNVNLNLKLPVLTGDGKIYYYLDTDNNGEANPSDLLNHADLDNLLNNGSDTIDTQEGEHDGSDDQRSVIVGAYTLILPTLAELQKLRTDQGNTYPSNWGNGFYNSATRDSANPNRHRLFDLGDASVMVADDDDASLNAYVAFQVLSAIPISFTQAEYTIVEGTTGTIILHAGQIPVEEARIRLITDSETVADHEYQLSTTVIVFEPGKSTRSFTVSIVDDDVIRSPRELRLSFAPLNSSAVPGAVSETVINVENNDVSSVTLTVAGDTVLEEGDSTTLQLTLARAFDQDTTIRIVTTGTATQGKDYDYTIGMNPVMFSAYSTYRETTLTITNDMLVEPDETIILTLASNNDLIITNRPEAQLTLTIEDRDVPAISFEQAEYTIVEGTTGTIILRADQTPVREARIELTTRSETVRNNEYHLSTTVIVFEPGQSTVSFGVSIFDDDVIRSLRELRLSFAPLNGSATLGAVPETVINIENNNMSPVTLAVTGGALTLEEGDSTTLQLTLARAFDQDTTIRIVNTGTATQGEDYTIDMNPLMFPAYSTYRETTLTITNDGLVEENETIILRLEANNDSIIVNRPEARLTLTIADRDVPAISFEQAEYTIVEGTIGTIILRAEQIPVREIQIGLTINSGTVPNDAYSLSLPATGLVFRPSRSTVSFTVSISADIDTADADADTISPSLGELRLSFTPFNDSATRGMTPETVINIKNDDMSPATLAVTGNDTALGEGDSTTLRITLARAFDQDTTIRIVSAGTAIQGKDYTINMNPLRFRAYSTYTETTLTVTNDSLVEPNETIILRLEANNDLIITNRPEAQLTLTIEDNDVPAISFEQAEYTIVEGTTGTIILRADQPPVREARIGLTINPGTVSANEYRLSTTVVVFEPSQSTRSFTVSILDDDIIRSPRELRLSLSTMNNSVARGTTPDTVINVENNDVSSVTLTVAGDTVLEEGDSTTLQLTLARAFDQDTTIDIVSTGTATQGEGYDYTINMNPLMFRAYSTYRETTLTVTNDSLVELNETIILTLNANNDLIITNRPEAQLTLTIEDNDVPAISFERDKYTIAEGTTGTITLRTDQPPVATVQISLTADSAMMLNYQLSPAVIVFDPGQSTASFEVSIMNDDDVQLIRELSLSFNLPDGNARYGATSETAITITDNDGLSLSTTRIDIAEDGGRESVIVEVSGLTGVTATVGVTVSGNKLEAIDKELIFTDSTTQSLTIGAINNRIYEGSTINEITFRLVNTGQEETLEVSITEDDPIVTVAPSELRIERFSTVALVIEANADVEVNVSEVESLVRVQGDKIFSLSREARQEVVFEGIDEGSGMITITVQANIDSAEQVITIPVTITTPTLALTAEPDAISIVLGSSTELRVNVRTTGGHGVTLRATIANGNVARVTPTIVTDVTERQTIKVSSLMVGETNITVSAEHPDYPTTSRVISLEVIDRLRILVAGESSETVTLTEGQSTDVAVTLNRLADNVTLIVKTDRGEIMTSNNLVFDRLSTETLTITSLPVDSYDPSRDIAIELSAQDYTTATVTVRIIEEEVPLSIDAPATLRFADNEDGELAISVSATEGSLPSAGIPVMLRITTEGNTVQLDQSALRFEDTQTRTVSLEALGLGVTTLTLTAGEGNDGYTETSATVVVEVVDRLRILVAGESSETVTLTEGQSTDVAVTLNRLADNVTLIVKTDRGEIMTSNNLVFDSLSTETLTITSLPVDSYDPSRDIAIELSAAGYTTATVMVRIIEEEVPLSIDAPATLRFADNEDGELSISVSVSGDSLPSAGIPARLRITTEGSTVQLDKSVLEFIGTDPQTVMLEALGLGVTTLTLTAGVGMDGYTETSATVVVEVIDRLRILVAGESSETVTLTEGQSTDVAVTLNRLADSVTLTVKTDRDEIMTANNLVFDSLSTKTLTITSLPVDSYDPSRDIAIELSAAGYTTATVMVRIIEEEVPLSIEAPTTIRFTDNVIGELVIGVNASGDSLPSAVIPARLRITTEGSTVQLDKSMLTFEDTQTQTVMLEALGLGITTLTLTAGVGTDDGYTETSATVVVEVLDRLRILVADESSATVTLREGQNTDVAVTLNRIGDTTVTVTESEDGLVTAAEELEFTGVFEVTLNIAVPTDGQFTGNREVKLILSAAGYTTATVMVRIIEEEVQLNIVAPTTIRFTDNEDGELSISVSVSGDSLPSAGIQARLQITTEGSTVQLDKSALTFADTQTQTVMLEALGLGITTLTLTAGEGNDGYTETSATVVIEVIDRLRILVADESSATVTLREGQNTDVAVTLNRIGDTTVTVAVTASQDGLVTVADELVFTSVFEVALNITVPTDRRFTGNREVKLTLSAEGYTTATVMVRIIEEEVPLSIDAPATLRFADNVMGELAISVNVPGGSLPSTGIPARLQITTEGSTVQLDKSMLTFEDTQTQTVMLEALGLGITTLTLTAGVGTDDGYTETSATVVVEVLDRLRILVADESSATVTLREGQNTDVAVMLNRIGDTTVTVTESEDGLVTAAEELEFTGVFEVTLNIAVPTDRRFTGNREVKLTLSAAGYTTATVMVRIIEEEVQLNIVAPTTIRFTDNLIGELAIRVNAAGGSLPSTGIPARLQITTEGSTVQLDKSMLTFEDTQTQTVMLEALGLGITTLTLTAGVGTDDGYTETSATVVVEVLDRLRILVADESSKTVTLRENGNTDVAVTLNRIGDTTVTVAVTASQDGLVTVADELVFTSVFEVALNITVPTDGQFMGNREVKLTLSAAGYTTATVMVRIIEEEVPLSIDAPATLRFADNEDGELSISVSVSGDSLPSAGIPARLRITTEGSTVQLDKSVLEFIGTDPQTVMLEALGLGVTTLTLTAGEENDGYTETSATVVVEVVDRLRILAAGKSSETVILTEGQNTDVAVTLNRLADSVTVTVMTDRGEIMTTNNLVFDSLSTATLTIESLPVDSYDPSRDIAIELSAAGYTTATVMVRIIEEEVPLSIDAPATLRFADNLIGELAIRVNASGGSLPSAGIQARLQITTEGSTVQLDKSALTFADTQTQTVMLEALGLGITTLTLTAGEGNDGYTETSATVVVEVLDRLRILVADESSATVTLREGQNTDVAVTLNRIGDTTVTVAVTASQDGLVTVTDELVFTSVFEVALNIAVPTDRRFTGNREVKLTLSAEGYTTATVMVRIIEEEVPLSIDAPATLWFADNVMGELAISVNMPGDPLPSAGIPARLRITTEGSTVQLDKSVLEFMDTDPQTVMLEALGLGITTLTLTAGVGMDGYTETSATVVVEVLDRLRILVADESSATVTLREGQNTDVAVTLNRLADSVTVTVMTDRGEIMTTNNLVFDSLSTATLTIESLPVDSYDPSRDIAIELSAAGYTTATVMVRIIEEEVQLNIVVPTTIRFTDNLIGELAIRVNAPGGSLPSTGIPARLQITTEGSTVQLDKSMLTFEDTQTQTVMLEALGLGITTLTLTAGVGMDGYTETSATVVVEVLDRLRILVADESSKTVTLRENQNTNVAVMLNRIGDTTVTVAVTASEDGLVTVTDELVFTSVFEVALNITVPTDGQFMGNREVKLTLSAAGYTTATVMVRIIEEEVSLSIKAPTTIRFTDNMMGELAISVNMPGDPLPSAGIPARLRITTEGSTVQLDKSVLEFMDTDPQTVSLEALGLGVTTLTLTAGVGMDGYTETNATVVVEVVDRLRILVAGDASETVTLTEGQSTDVAVTLNRLADSVTVTVMTDRGEIMTTNNLVFDSLSPATLTIESLPVDSYDPSRDIAIELSAAGYTTATVMVRIIEEEVQLNIVAPTTIQFTDNVMGELAISVNVPGGSLPSTGIPARLQITTEGSTVQLDKSVLEFMDTDPQTVMLEALGLGITTLTLTAGVGMDGYTETSATVVVEVLDRLRILVADESSKTVTLRENQNTNVAVMLNRIGDTTVTVAVTASEDGLVTVMDELEFTSGLEKTLNITVPTDGQFMGNREVKLTLSAAGYTTATVMVRIIEEEVSLSIKAPTTIRFTDNMMGELAISVNMPGDPLPSAGIPARLRITTEGSTVQLDKSVLEFIGTDPQTVSLEALGLGVTTLTLTAGVGMDGYTETNATVVVEVVDRLRILAADGSSATVILTEGQNTDVAVTLNRIGDTAVTVAVTESKDGLVTVMDELVFTSGLEKTLNITVPTDGQFMGNREVKLTLSAAGYTTATVIVRIIEGEVSLSIEAPTTIRFTDNVMGELAISVNMPGDPLPSAGIPARLRITTEGSTVQLDKSALVFMDTAPQTVMLEALGLGVTTLTLTAGEGNDGYTETSATVVVEVLKLYRIGFSTTRLELVEGDETMVAIQINDATGEIVSTIAATISFTVVGDGLTLVDSPLDLSESPTEFTLTAVESGEHYIDITSIDSEGQVVVEAGRERLTVIVKRGVLRFRIKVFLEGAQ